ncbi:MAG: ABC transporter permease [Actinobacteria bacterium]|nr:ABC transporter permease [Actinomycetota bacterium]MBV8479783.1 ABC transporter permease [Actinomycetota bacterium]
MSAAAPAIPRLEKVGRVTQARVILSEWTKLYSLRSTRWSLFAAVLLTIGLPAIFAAVTNSHWAHMSPHDRADRHPLDIALAGVNLSQLAIGVLGVLVITGEYATGMIRSSFIAVPKRLPVLWAKIVVFASVVFALMLPSVLIAFWVSQSILHKIPQLQTSLSAHGVLRSVAGGALYLVLFGIFCLAFGAIVRNTAGGIASFVALFFVIPPLLNVFPTSWQNAINPWIPNSAFRSIFQLTHGSHSLSPWGGLAVSLGYTAFAVGVAAVLLVRRDA